MLPKKEMKKIEAMWQFHDQHGHLPFEKKMISFRLPYSTIIKLRERSKKEGRNMSDIINKSI